MKNVSAKLAGGGALFGLSLLLAACSVARLPRVVLRADFSDPVLAVAALELESFLGPAYAVARAGAASRPDWTIDLAVDRTMPEYSFSVRTVAASGSAREPVIELRGPTPSGVLQAAYTMLEKAGLRFDADGPIRPARPRLEDLLGFSRVIRPAVSRRGIRQHINFAMDISSYPVEEAKEYIRNLARLRLNTITFHSYPGQWYPSALKGEPARAGNFFYGQRHDLPDDPFLRKVIRNRSVFCIPAIEPFYEQPEEKSRLAMAWLEEVIAEAKRVGLTVHFSMELREGDPRLSLETCRGVLARYPGIDALELITQEDGAKSGPEIEYNARVLKALREGPPSSKAREFGLGIYNTGVEDLRPGLEALRRTAPADVHLTILPAHGARKAVENLRAIPVLPADAARLLFYSWVEFDGLMYLQQNPVEGIRRLIEEGRRLSGGEPLYGIGWNHWRTAENRTALVYAAAAMIEGPLEPKVFYEEYGRALGLGRREAYAAAMAVLDDADTLARDDLFNIGFCYGGYWTSPKGLANYGRYEPEKIEGAMAKFESAREGLASCLPATESAAGRRYLEFLDNRLGCTLLHLRAFRALAGVQPLFAGKPVRPLTPVEKERVGAAAGQALALETEYLKLHARMILDRGCEGTLVSYYGGPVQLLKRILSEYGGAGALAGPADKTLDAPPAPAGKK
jgi:hypothetical protein